MIKNKTIICFASGFNAPPTGKHHIMRLMSKKNQILWINYHASRTPSASGSDILRILKKLVQIFKGAKKINNNFFVLTPLVIPLPSLKPVKKINKKLLILQIKFFLKRLKNRPVQVWSFTPDISYVLGNFNEEKVLYYCVDDHSSFKGYDKNQVLNDEKELCKKSDIVLTTSVTLQNSKKGFNKNTFLLPHGVDFNHFSKALNKNFECPKEIIDIKGPKFGFFGLIRDWVDLDLIYETANKKPEWNFIFIGDADSNVDLGKYKNLENIYFLGRKPYDELPGFCKFFDAGIIPFKINKLTIAVNPIKLREYLSAGLGVISTPMPEVAIYKEMVNIVNNSDEFIKAGEKILNEDKKSEIKKRLDKMSLETWDKKADLICSLICLRRVT